MARSQALLLVLVTACDAQVEPGYQGESLLTLTAAVTSDEPLPDDLEIEMTWVDFVSGDSCDGDSTFEFSGFHELDVEVEFPNRYTFEVTESPERWLNDFTRGGQFPGESRIGLAEVYSQGGDLDSHPWQVLVFVERDIRPGTVSETFAGGILTAGFHVLERVAAPCDSYLAADDPAEGTLDCLRPTPEDLETEFDLVLFPIGSAELPRPHLYKANLCDCDPDAEPDPDECPFRDP
jgi:hypothetical protein